MRLIITDGQVTITVQSEDSFKDSLGGCDKCINKASEKIMTVVLHENKVPQNSKNNAPTSSKLLLTLRLTCKCQFPTC